MNKNKILKINGTTLDQEQLKNHLEKIATNHNLVNKSQKNTYPIPYLEENFKIIEEVYIFSQISLIFSIIAIFKNNPIFQISSMLKFFFVW